MNNLAVIPHNKITNSAGHAHAVRDNLDRAGQITIRIYLVQIIRSRILHILVMPHCSQIGCQHKYDDWTLAD